MLSMKNLGIVYRNFAKIQQALDEGTPWAKIAFMLNKRLKTNIDELSVEECYKFVKHAEEFSGRRKNAPGG